MFRRKLVTTLIVTILLSATAAADPGLSPPGISLHEAHSGTWVEKPEWEQYFSSQHVTGSVLLYDLQTDQYFSYDAKRANKRYIPASTFKVLNSLIALELGVIADADEILPWDGIVRDVPAWNQDHSMRQAIRNSTVWFYQELARRIRYERMRDYVQRVGYGNRNIRGGVDRFWLDGKLRISSTEQLKVLVALHQNTLPFSQRSINIVKDILITEQTDTYILRSKTGWARCWDFLPDCRAKLFDPQIGWIIGYVERDGKAYFFAVNIDILKDQDAVTRTSIAKAVLRDMKIIE